MIYKTILAPNAPWYFQKKKKTKPVSRLDLKFNEWCKKNGIKNGT